MQIFLLATWRHFEVVKFTQNMRVALNYAAGSEDTSLLDQHAKWLLDVGDRVLNDGNILTVPSHLCMPPSTTPFAGFLDG
eukprot:1716607-Pleurochrysis_carterae.AAC.2